MPDTDVSLRVQGGSYNQFNADVTAGINLDESSHIIHYSKNTSEGYRFNIFDFDNQNFVLKSTFNKNLPIAMLISLSDRNFGANGFMLRRPPLINMRKRWRV